MDSELGRQIGHGLNNLSASLLAHQQASARDRSAMLDKIDTLSDKMDGKFDTLAERIIDVCDRGGTEHRDFAHRLDAIELRLATQEARREGSNQFKQTIQGAVTWTLEHGWKLALVLYVGWTQIEPIIARATGLQ